MINPTPQPENLALLERISAARDAWAPFRERRRRNKRYTYGRQWDDLVDTPHGRMTEGEALRREGETPLVNNLIRRTVRNIVGVWRSNYSPSEKADPSLRECWQRNRMDELNARTLEEFLISGLAIHRKWHGRRGAVTSSWTDFVSPETFFMESDTRDFRGWDLRLVGEIHDMDFDDLCARFASSPEDVGLLEAVYGHTADAPESRFSAFDRCRVIEVWRPVRLRSWICHDPVNASVREVGDADVKAMRAENRRRLRSRLPQIAMRQTSREVWTWAFLSPAGHLLASGETPYAHGSHPFVVKAYPYIDGEIHSFVSDVIDQQRFTNRLITIYDRALRASAKGVLLFPEHALPPGADLMEIADQWSRADGVIMYTAKAGMPLPQQAGGLSSSLGISDLLQIQLKMMEDISGVNSALQGKLESSSTSGTLYERQTLNALTSLKDITESFASFVAEGAAKDLANIRQFGC